MAKFKYKYVKVPKGMKIGSKVLVVGEGFDKFTILDIVYHNITKQVDKIILDSGWNEPLSKIFLYTKNMFLEENRIFVAIGECDVCGKTFPDSCVYKTIPTIKDSMICIDCDYE